MLLQFVYASAATQPFSAVDLNRLLDRARPRNDLYGVTGMLLYQSGSFLQVLEGPAQGVEAVYQRILLDKRHAAPKILLRHEIARREFEGWSMGFTDTSIAVHQPDGFVDFYRVLPALTDAPTKASQYLRFFQQGLCRAR